MIHLCKSVHGEYFNRIVAANGRIVAVSETFKTRKGAMKNLDALKRIFAISNAKAKTFVKDKTS